MLVEHSKSWPKNYIHKIFAVFSNYFCQPKVVPKSVATLAQSKTVSATTTANNFSFGDSLLPASTAKTTQGGFSLSTTSSAFNTTSTAASSKSTFSAPSTSNATSSTNSAFSFGNFYFGPPTTTSTSTATPAPTKFETQTQPTQAVSKTTLNNFTFGAPANPTTNITTNFSFAPHSTKCTAVESVAQDDTILISKQTGNGKQVQFALDRNTFKSPPSSFSFSESLSPESALDVDAQTQGALEIQSTSNTFSFTTPAAIALQHEQEVCEEKEELNTSSILQKEEEEVNVIAEKELESINTEKTSSLASFNYTVDNNTSTTANTFNFHETTATSSTTAAASITNEFEFKIPTTTTDQLSSISSSDVNCFAFNPIHSTTTTKQENTSTRLFSFGAALLPTETTTQKTVTNEESFKFTKQENTSTPLFCFDKSVRPAVAKEESTTKQDTFSFGSTTCLEEPEIDLSNNFSVHINTSIPELQQQADTKPISNGFNFGTAVDTVSSNVNDENATNDQQQPPITVSIPSTTESSTINFNPTLSNTLETEFTFSNSNAANTTTANGIFDLPSIKSDFFSRMSSSISNAPDQTSSGKPIFGQSSLESGSGPFTLVSSILPLL